MISSSLDFGAIHASYAELMAHEPLTCARLDYLIHRLDEESIPKESLIACYLNKIHAILKSQENFSYFPFSEAKKSWFITVLNEEPDSDVVLLKDTYQSEIASLRKGAFEVVLKKSKGIPSYSALATSEWVEAHYSSAFIFAAQESYIRKLFEEEISYHMLCDHPNIATCFPAVGEGMLVTEKLERTLTFAEDIPYLMIKNIAKDALQALAYLHQKGLVHGDIHEENIGFKDGHWKLFDLGSMTSIGARAKGAHFDYLTIERQSESAYLTKAEDDVFALAVCMMRLFTNHPYAIASTGSFFGSHFATIAKEHQFPEKLGNFLWHCLNEDPDIRFNTAQALDHPLFHHEKPVCSLMPSKMANLRALLAHLEHLPFIDHAEVSLESYDEAYTFYQEGLELLKVFLDTQEKIAPLAELKSSSGPRYVLLDHALRLPIHAAITSVMGRSFGAIDHEYLGATLEHLPDFYWNLDPKYPWAAKHKDQYRKKIYPLACSIIGNERSINCARVLELCGGNGDFAFQMRHFFSARIEKYCLCDLNRPSLEKAALRFSTDPKFLIELGDVTKKETFSSILEKAGMESASLILGIGALTQQVLPDKKAALTSLALSFDVLESGGHILLTGLGRSWITAVDLENAGFIVLETMAYGHYCYLAKKP